MTAAFQAAGTGVLTATSGAACTPGNPAGIVAGNALIAHVFYGGSTTSPDTPTDWSLLDGPRDLSTPATNGRVWVYGKKAVGGDAAPAFGTQAVTTPRRARVYRFDGVLDDTIANMVGGFDYATGTSAAVSDTGVTTGADAQDYLAVNFVAISENPTIGPFTGETGGDWTEAVAEFTGTTGTPDTCMQIQTAVVAPSTTINGGTVTPSTTNPWGVVGFYIRSAVPKTTAATLAETPAESTWTGTGTSKSTSTGGNGSGTVSWQAGDTVYVFGATAQASSTTLGTPTHAGANLPAFAAVGAAVGSGAQCWAHTWSATATGSGSSVISETATSSSDPWGIIAWVVRGSDGTGTRASDVSATKTVSLTRSDAHSLVFELIADYAAGSATLTWTPSGQTQREATQAAGLYSVGVADWGDQGSAGATSYGVSAGFDATGPLTKIALEILGTVSSGQTVNAGQVIETESSRPVTLLKTETAGQVTETETAQASTVRRNLNAGQVTETETSRAVTTRKTVVLGQVVETELAQSVSTGQAQEIPIGQVTETESARPVTLLKTETAGQVIETETSRAVTLLKTETAGQVTETETSRAVTTRKSVVLGQVIETELARPVTLGGAQNVSIGQVIETETARPVTLRRTKSIGQIIETETARPVTFKWVVNLGQVIEFESVLALTVDGGAPVFTVGAARASVSLVATGKSTAGVGGKASVSPAGSGAHSEDGG